MNIFKKVLDVFKEDTPPPKSKEVENNEIIDIYNSIKEAVPTYNEPNYKLAEKVFREFNRFNLKNIEVISNSFISDNIPKSLLPYPKNYIKCAYCLFLENAKKNDDLEMFKLIEDVGVSLFFRYPDYDRYKRKLKRTKEMEESWNHLEYKDSKELDTIERLKNMFKNGKEAFKNLYGVYEVSESDYHNSPNSIDCTNEKLIHDFGFLPEIEKDVDLDK